VTGTATTVSLHLEDGQEVTLSHAEGEALAATIVRMVRHQATVAQNDRLGRERDEWLELVRRPVEIKEGI
jgi:hypothetical protein